MARGEPDAKIFWPVALLLSDLVAVTVLANQRVHVFVSCGTLFNLPSVSVDGCWIIAPTGRIVHCTIGLLPRWRLAVVLRSRLRLQNTVELLNPDSLTQSGTSIGVVRPRTYQGELWRRCLSSQIGHF